MVYLSQSIQTTLLPTQNVSTSRCIGTCESIHVIFFILQLNGYISSISATRWSVIDTRLHLDKNKVNIFSLLTKDLRFFRPNAIRFCVHIYRMFQIINSPLLFWKGIVSGNWHKHVYHKSLSKVFDDGTFIFGKPSEILEIWYLCCPML